MKPIDKFGREIRPHIYQRMLKYANQLHSAGYKESDKKSNLFYKTEEEWGYICFADMRGTEEVPIWEDPAPLFYINFSDKKKIPDWEKRRFFRQEFFELGFCRASFHDEWLMDDEDGYCRVCSKDFMAPGLFCSDQCKEAYEELAVLFICRLCGKPVKKTTGHHLNYAQDKTIDVCRSCHLKIHRGKEFPKLAPNDKGPSRKEE